MVQVMRDPTYEDSRYIETHKIPNDFNLKENITLVGPDYNSLCFLAIIANMRESPMDLYDPLIYDWVILPSCINILHIFTFYQDIKYVKDAFSHKFPYFSMSNELSSSEYCSRSQTKN